MLASDTQGPAPAAFLQSHQEPLSLGATQETLEPPCPAECPGLSYRRFRDILAGPEQPADEEFLAALKDMNINPALEPYQLGQVRKVILACQQAFALPDRTYPYGQLGEPVDLRVNHPWPMLRNLKKSPYPLSARARLDVKAQVDKLQKAGLITRSRSPYAAPTFCTYRGSKPRPVHDYRAINEYLEAPGYPLPNMPKLVRSLKGAQYLSSIDIMDAFFCMKLREQEVYCLRH